jgi:hypothetical protein
MWSLGIKRFLIKHKNELIKHKYKLIKRSKKKLIHVKNVSSTAGAFHILKVRGSNVEPRNVTCDR